MTQFSVGLYRRRIEKYPQINAHEKMMMNGNSKCLFASRLSEQLKQVEMNR